MNTINHSSFLEEKKKWNILLVIFLIIGIAIRLYHYLYNRSLWMDEVYLSSSFLRMDGLEILTKPLYYQQKAPIGFLLFVKYTVQLFGNKEMALRLIPLISGISSLFLFIPVANYFLRKPAAVLAIGILCLSPALVYHSVEIKQYSTELLATLCSFYLYIKYRSSNQFKDLLFWGLSGALILWFSYSAIFILGGIAISLSSSYLLTKKWDRFAWSILPFGLWLISFLANYFLFTHKHAESEWIALWFRSYGNFMPFPPKSLSDLQWFAVNLYRMMDYPLGLLWNFNQIENSGALSILVKLPFIPLFLLIYGSYAFFKERTGLAWILFSPILLTLLASGLELYPLTERFWVFISPIFILLIAKGFECGSSRIKSKKLRLLFLLLVIMPALVQSAIFLWKPDQFYVHKKSEQREALQFLDLHYKKGDAVYVYWNNLPGYRAYKTMYPLKYEAIEGTNQRKYAKNYRDYEQLLKADFSKFTGKKRVWLVFNTQFLTDIGDGIDEPTWYYKDPIKPMDHLLSQFNKLGKPIAQYVTKDVSVYLFELPD
ncbi:glycosyltransferase family 39 protein [Pedobacter gandavensis]|uniref:Glycosyltransferase RgtA/B/C/D-like domain-containing protein n=1 Tax=Pedobacter gandavensis TaxID=2679963 RepID=A0ABR6ET14_9SPHI|nr:glycosyltransferase family 39 protein [Pedobacter gandavensis]MBB2148410.1 hypothetical protein [Pedobacter gandavensis]